MGSVPPVDGEQHGQPSGMSAIPVSFEMSATSGEDSVAADIEVILMKQVASYLVMPIFVVDPSGTLMFYNEPAEALLGLRYDETGEMPMDEWGTVFVPTDADGNVIAASELPLAVALTQRRPAHGRFSITSMDGRRHHLAVTAFPLVGQHERELGAVALFWEEPA